LHLAPFLLLAEDVGNVIGGEAFEVFMGGGTEQGDEALLRRRTFWSGHLRVEFLLETLGSEGLPGS
jgi:hypothetical protein